MSVMELIEAGVDQGGVHAVVVIKQVQMLALLLDGEIDVGVDVDPIALVGVEVGDDVFAG